MSNADIGKTMAQILGLKIPFKGALMGRVIDEALPGGDDPQVETLDRARQARRRTGLPRSWSGSASAHRYFDAAGFPGRTVGLDERKAASR